MGLRLIAVEVCRGRQIGCGARVALSDLPGLADALGWLLALAARTAVDRTYLDSTRPVRSLSTHACVAA